MSSVSGAGEKGSCLVYDNKQLGTLLMVLVISSKLGSIFFFSLGAVASSRSKILDDTNS